MILLWETFIIFWGSRVNFWNWCQNDYNLTDFRMPLKFLINNASTGPCKPMWKLCLIFRLAMPAHSWLSKQRWKLRWKLDKLWQHITAPLLPLVSHQVWTLSLIGIHLAHPHKVQTWSFVHLIDSIDNQDMHQVMWVEEEVKSSWEPAFGYVWDAHKSSCHGNGILWKYRLD